MSPEDLVHTILRVKYSKLLVESQLLIQRRFDSMTIKQAVDSTDMLEYREREMFRVIGDMMYQKYHNRIEKRDLPETGQEEWIARFFVLQSDLLKELVTFCIKEMSEDELRRIRAYRYGENSYPTLDA